MEDRAHRAAATEEIRVGLTREWLEPQSRYERMMEIDGDELAFTIENTDGNPETTVSLEAMRAVRELMATWVGTRMVRRMNIDKKPAKHPHIKVSVEWED